MTTNTTNRDNFKTLRKAFNLTNDDIRAIAADLDVTYEYRADLHTWVITSDVQRFYAHLVEMTGA